MKNALLIRSASSSEGTFGAMIIENSTVSVVTGELPWKDNARKVSCIPVGEYKCTWITSPKFGGCYTLLNVPNRGDILIHPANFMGDEALGFDSELLGCIALGKTVGKLKNSKGNMQKALLSSKVAIREFQEFMGKEDFILEIVEG